LRFARNPPKKLLIKGGHGLQPEKVLMQAMTAFGSFNKLIRLPTFS
jgi:hypothetical protein